MRITWTAYALACLARVLTRKNPCPMPPANEP